jgi:hypothetical protein
LTKAPAPTQIPAVIAPQIIPQPRKNAKPMNDRLIKAFKQRLATLRSAKNKNQKEIQAMQKMLEQVQNLNKAQKPRVRVQIRPKIKVQLRPKALKPAKKKQ